MEFILIDQKRTFAAHSSLFALPNHRSDTDSAIPMGMEIFPDAMLVAALVDFILDVIQLIAAFRIMRQPDNFWDECPKDYYDPVVHDESEKL